MRYVAARRESRIRETSYRNYVCDTLKMIAENTAKQYGGVVPAVRFADVLTTKPDTRTGDEIVADVLERGGIKVVD